ncbi:hypothetical protein DFP72DRAFT_860098 [Ephemerocybe angulata]|uniref:Uncharacterized protein n=1 Tax=Ephemerocybe angulata TaxID=980116 RepID=A0A8H6H976_9AGAR|nr:hypothetical protein DFP72DRAFT_860098 [Tulosesus angulatus]
MALPALGSGSQTLAETGRNKANFEELGTKWSCQNQNGRTNRPMAEQWQNWQNPAQPELVQPRLSPISMFATSACTVLLSYYSFSFIVVHMFWAPKWMVRGKRIHSESAYHWSSGKQDCDAADPQCELLEARASCAPARRGSCATWARLQAGDCVAEWEGGRREKVVDGRQSLPLANTKVPHLQVPKLQGTAGLSHLHHSAEAQLAQGDDKVFVQLLHWFCQVPVFHIREIQLADLLTRGKNTKEGKWLAKEQAGRMADWVADASSMILCDEDGEDLLCMYSWSFGREVLRKVGDEIDFKNAPYYPGAEGRTLADVVPDIRSPEGKMILKRSTYHDGFMGDQVRDYHVVLQEVSVNVNPVANKRDMRYPEDVFMAYPAY